MGKIDSAIEKRIAALQAFDIMDTPPEEDFDDLTHLASFICRWTNAPAIWMRPLKKARFPS